MTEFSGQFSRVIHWALKSWAPPILPPRRIRSLLWGERDVSGLAKTVSLGTDTMTIVAVAPEMPTGQHLPLNDLLGKPIKGRTEDGWVFEANSAVATSWSTRPNNDGTEITIKGWRWAISRSDATPALWIANLNWKPPSSIGNLSVSIEGPLEAMSFSRTHYYLRSPELNIVLLCRDNGTWVFVAEQAHADRLQDLDDIYRSINRDLSALAYAFGTPFAIERFYAIDEHGDPNGVLGSSFPEPPHVFVRNEGPVPSLGDTTALPVVLFEKLTAFMGETSRQTSRDIDRAIDYATECMEEYTIESRIAKMMLSVMAASRFHMPEARVLADDNHAWIKWVDSRTDEIVALSGSESKDALLERIKRSVQLDPISLVEAAAAEAGVTVTAEVRKALTEGIHILRGAASSRQDVLPLIRATSAAMIARAINYNGRLAGWKRHGGYAIYEDAPNAWWKPTAGVMADNHVIEIDGRSSNMASMWPDIQVPAVPDVGPIGLLARYAGGLSRKTNGRVYADIQPLPRENNNATASYVFSIRPARVPTAKIVLFVVRDEPGGASVEGWSGKVKLSSTEDVEKFARAVGASDRTQAAIERALIVSLEAEYNGAG